MGKYTIFMMATINKLKETLCSRFQSTGYLELLVFDASSCFRFFVFLN